MKKSLIALAVIAVSGTAFAQSTVTLSGKARFAYESTKSAAGAKANGLRVTDGDFVLTAVEDLGGGLKASANMAVQSRGRDTAIAGRDASLSLSGGFGSVMIGSIEAGNGIIGLGGAGAPVYGLDSGVIAAASNVDILMYTSPTMNGFNFTLNTTDTTAKPASITASGTAFATTTAAAETLGLDGTSATASSTGVGIRYAAGPLAAAADLTNYNNNAAGTTHDSRTRMSASYDLGVAKIGAGFQTYSTTANVDTKDQIFGVTVPMGAITLGLNVASSKTAGVTKKGTDFGAKYDLSKRTFVAAQYQTSKAAAGAASASKFRIQLAHAF